MIRVQGLTKYYRGRPAIKDVTFEINEGEIVGLLGLNGAGKTTILKILSSLLTSSEGAAQIGGFDVDSQSLDVRRLVGFLADKPPLYDEMTVESYLRFMARIRDVPKNAIGDAVERSIDRTHCHEVRRKALGALSHGYRQRVSIGAALVHDPKVLILDEPTNGLDPVQIVEVRDMVKSFRGKHTVLVSSHILSEITKTCDRIMVIHEGHLVGEGSEASLRDRVDHQAVIECEVRRWGESLESEIRGIAGVTGVETSRFRQEADSTVVTIQAEDDVREQISSAIVQAEAGLLRINSSKVGLESVFMSLVGADAPSASEKVQEQSVDQPSWGGRNVA